MAISQKPTVYRSCRLLLRPVVSLVMKCGMTWKEFADLAKLAFVEVATGEFGIRGRPTNVSRVSILTGISRKEIARQRSLLAATDGTSSAKTNDATRLLSGWHQDSMYLDRKGAPLPLVERGPAPSFEALFQLYGGDTPFQTLLKELKAAGSITEDDVGKLVAMRRYHMPTPLSEENIRLFGSNLFEHARTLERNITGRAEHRRFEGAAADDRVAPADAEEFRRFLNERGQQFLEEIDDWLARHRATAMDSDSVPIRLGVGLYAIDGQLPAGKQS
ncbi:MAG: DUF6502 family protein [Gammaproteobacteria bacterium]|nr:DUF6502 family protein [Gammaproteobacteria bacterium]